MPRSQYIYLVRYREPGHPGDEKLLAAFTVKKEAIQWADLCPFNRRRITLSRMRDGLIYNKVEQVIPWEDDREFRQEYLQEPSKPAGSTQAPETRSKTQKVRNRAMELVAHEMVLPTMVCDKEGPRPGIQESND